MIIEQTVEIPFSRRLIIDVPPEVPAGKVLITFTPVPTKNVEKSKTPISDRLAGCLANIGDIDIEEIRKERLAKYLL